VRSLKMLAAVVGFVLLLAIVLLSNVAYYRWLRS
jgi:hypothetical protein